MAKKCGQCKSYLRGGDWGLSCKQMYGLTYEDSDACSKFEQEETCKNNSRIVGGFFCSICGHFVYFPGAEDNDFCPVCHHHVGEKVEE